MNKWVIPIDEWEAMKKAGKAWEILVPDWLPSAMNDLIKKSWNSYLGEKRWIQHYMSTNCRLIPPALEKRGVQILIVKKSGLLDDEPNLDARSKATMDAMSALKFIRDDNPQWLEWHHVWQMKGKQKGMVVRIWEAYNG